MSHRRHLAAIVVLVVLAMVAACNRGGTETSARPRVGLVLKTLNSPFFIEMQRGAEEAAKRLRQRRRRRKTRGQVTVWACQQEAQARMNSAVKLTAM